MKYINFDKNKLEVYVSDLPHFQVDKEGKRLEALLRKEINLYTQSFSFVAEEFESSNLQLRFPQCSELIAKASEDFYMFEVESVNLYVPEILGDSLETAVKVVKGEIIPRVFVQVQGADYIEYHISVPDCTEYHYEIEESLELFLGKTRYLEGVEVSMTSPEGMAAYILSEGGAYWSGNCCGWVIDPNQIIKDEMASQIVEMWYYGESPTSQFEAEVFECLKARLS